MGVGIFATGARRASTPGPEASEDLSEDVRLLVPRGFEAVGEALASGADPSMASDLLGRRLARDGVPLAEALDMLQRTARAVTGGEPGFTATQALAVAWGEATVAFLHQVSCEDPLTGLASTAHLRARLSELYRGELRDRGVASRWALVVLDLPLPGDPVSGGLALARAGQLVRTSFAGDGTVARLAGTRIGVLAEREQQLGRRAALLQRLVAAHEPRTRSWIEGLPSTDTSAGLLLDELARG